MTSVKKDRTVADWMGIFSDLYAKADSARTPEQMWIAVMAHSSSIGECIRRYSFGRKELLRNVAHTFCWLCSFVDKCNTLEEDNVFSFSEKLCEMVSFKYPLACGLCGKNICECSPPEVDAIPDKLAKYTELFEKRQLIIDSVPRYSVSDWKGIFRGIYGGRVHILTIESIGFHFLEEVGEEAFAVRKLSQLQGIVHDKIEGIDPSFLKELRTVSGIVNKYKEYHQPEQEMSYTSRDPNMLGWRIVDAKIGMVVEIADTFSWLCAILNKLDSIASSSGFELPSFEDALNEEYIDGEGNARCPTCVAKPCSCVFFS